MTTILTEALAPELPAPVRQLEKTLAERVEALLQAPSPTRLLEVAEVTFELKQAGFARQAAPSLRHMLAALRAGDGNAEMADAAGFLLGRATGAVDGGDPEPTETPGTEDPSSGAASTAPASSSGLGASRIFGVFAPGETSQAATAEQLLSCTGAPRQVDAFMDWMEPAQDQGINPPPAATTAVWNDKRLDIIDIPGRVDLDVELERCLRVLDGVVLVMDGATGQEPRTEAAWRRVGERRIPRIVFVDGMDKTGAAFDRSVASASDRLGVRALPIQLPIGSGAQLKGLVDLIRMKALAWDETAPGGAHREAAIPDALLDQARAARARLVEALAERGGDASSEASLRRALRSAVLAGAIAPVFCGSIIGNKGVRSLLDAVVDYLPSPTDAPPARGVDLGSGNEIIRKASDDEPLSALAFKVAQDRLLGSLTFCRIYSGRMEAGATLLNTTRGQRERVGRMLVMRAGRYEDVETARAGDIIALSGLKTTCTGDTLCDPLKSPAILERMALPSPVVEIVVEPRSTRDRERLHDALRQLTADDPSLFVWLDQSGRTILKGASEQHLEARVERLMRAFGVNIQVGAPRAAYRETISRSATVDYTHKKQAGRMAQFARVRIAFEPGQPGSGFAFDPAIADGSVPAEFIPSIQKGLEAARSSGLLAGFPVVDLKAVLIGGAADEAVSSFLDFELAARGAFQELLGKGEPKLLEPIMKIEVATPKEHLGVILGDLNGRRGSIQTLDERGHATIAKALVPLAELFGYARDLQSLSQGLAQFTMAYDHYGQAPEQVVRRMSQSLA